MRTGVRGPFPGLLRVLHHLFFDKMQQKTFWSKKKNDEHHSTLLLWGEPCNIVWLRVVLHHPTYPFFLTGCNKKPFWSFFFMSTTLLCFFGENPAILYGWEWCYNTLLISFNLFLTECNKIFRSFFDEHNSTRLFWGEPCNIIWYLLERGEFFNQSL